jgi:hypothetical protein
MKLMSLMKLSKKRRENGKKIKRKLEKKNKKMAKNLNLRKKNGN